MTEIIIPIITGIVCLAVGVVIGFLYRKSVAEKAIGDAETEATRIINEAIKAGETKKRESVLEAKDEIHRQRVEADRELKERRNETQQLERRLIQREEALDKKSDTLDRKNEELSRHLESVQKKENELQRIKDEQVEKLEQIASMTRDEAREMLVNSIEAEAQHDAAVKVRRARRVGRGRTPCRLCLLAFLLGRAAVPLSPRLRRSAHPYCAMDRDSGRRGRARR